MSVSVADTANKAVMSSEALRLVNELVVPSGTCASLPCTQGLGRPSTFLAGNRRKDVQGFAKWSSHPSISVVVFPGASAAGDHPLPPYFVSTISPFFKTTFILSS